jgi:hypothetical protein
MGRGAGWRRPELRLDVMPRMLARSAFALLIAVGGGCAQLPRDLPGPARDGDAGACCEGAEVYPAWTVALVEPAAPVIGSTIGRIVWRAGHLTPEAQRYVLERLEPLDIVLMSSKGRLSGRTIPGLFGHVAVYLGTERDLRRAGLWNHAAVRPHHAAIRDGAVFVEADMKGVHLSRPAIVLNTDRAAVLRPRLGRAARQRVIAALYAHLGARFDFHFDNDDPECLYCAELVRHVAPELDLPSRRIYGRETTLPDEIAIRALEGGSRLEPVAYAAARPGAWRAGSAAELRTDIETHWAAQQGYRRD